MNSYGYDITSFGSGFAGQNAAIAAVTLGEKVTVIDMREVLGGVAPRDRRSLREAILYLAVSVLRRPPSPESDATTEWRSSVQKDAKRESAALAPHVLWLKRSQRPEE
jgi:predicted S18 family serine protease